MTSFVTTQRETVFPRHYIHQAVFTQQVGMLYAQSYFGALATAIAGAGLVYVLLGDGYDMLVYAWYSVLCAVTLARVLLALSYYRAGDDSIGRARWFILFWCSAMITAVLWAAAGSMLLIVQDQVKQMLLLLILVGMAAGAAPVLCAVKWVFENYVLILITPVFVWLLMKPLGGHGVILGMVLLVFVLGLLRAAAGFRNAIQSSLRLAVENEKIAKDLHQASEAKMLFLANMSHEIRTPMNAVIGMGRMLSETELSSRQQNYVDIIRSSSQGLLKIINDVLDFSKVEAGMLEVEQASFQLSGVVDNVVNLLVATAEEKGIELVCSIDPKVPDELIGDPLRLGQVLINLTQNAIKFTEKGYVAVSIAARDQHGQRLTLACSVRDTGIGISTDKIGSLFDPFTQADESTTRQYGGTGLGLAICNRLVELMGGTIHANSQLGEGSHFDFTAKFKSVPLESPELPSPELDQKRVWVIDRCPAVIAVVQKQLETLALKPEAFPTCIDAFKATEQVHKEIDFLIISGDYIEAEDDDLHALETRLAQLAGKPVPTLIMTTACQREITTILAANRPVCDVLQKPVMLAALKDSLHQILHQKSALSTPVSEQVEIESPVEPVTVTDSAASARVLLVDDHLYNQIVAQNALDQLGVTVITASSGRGALKTLEKESVDLVLMDIQMPDMDGFEVTHEIRNMDHLQDLPIIAMTAHAVNGYKEKCLAAGMNDYLAKPFAPSDLYHALQQWINVKAIPEAPSKVYQSSELLHSLGLPEQLSGIDVQAGLYHVGGNVELYKQLLLNFQTQQSEAFTQIMLATQAEETEQVIALAHNLRSICGNLGAHRLKQLIEDLEAGVKHGKIADKYPLAEVIDLEYQRIVASLTDLVLAPVKIDTDPLVSDQTEVLNELFADLQNALERGDTEALTIVRQMRRLSGDEWGTCSLLEVEKKLLHYEFDTALEIIYNESQGAMAQ